MTIHPCTMVREGIMMIGQSSPGGGLLTMLLLMPALLSMSSGCAHRVERVSPIRSIDAFYDPRNLPFMTMTPVFVWDVGLYIRKSNQSCRTTIDDPSLMHILDSVTMRMDEQRLSISPYVDVRFAILIHRESRMDDTMAFDHFSMQLNQGPLYRLDTNLLRAISQRMDTVTQDHVEGVIEIKRLHGPK